MNLLAVHMIRKIIVRSLVRKTFCNLSLKERKLAKSFKQLAPDQKILTRTWMQFIIRAIEEDLARGMPSCGNKYCGRLQPDDPKGQGWDQRMFAIKKEWLCETCILAYDHKQFCEFCFQIYLENTSEFSALDGKGWAQCEGDVVCGRWAHVDCLAEAYHKKVEEVVDENFKYVCCNCKTVIPKKRKASINRYD